MGRDYRGLVRGKDFMETMGAEGRTQSSGVK